MAKRRPSTLSLGSISHGTMREEDLIPDFIWECNRLRLSQSERATVRRIARVMHVDGYYDTESAADDCASLFDILDAHCPDYCTFGAHPGDGCDYGVWPSEDVLEGYCDNTVARISDTSELSSVACGPGEYTHALHVNDHGNATLYRRAGNRWVECWSVV